MPKFFRRKGTIKKRYNKSKNVKKSSKVVKKSVKKGVTLIRNPLMAN